MVKLLTEFKNNIEGFNIVTAGNTGYEQAAIKAAYALNVPIKILTPVNYEFINEEGKTIKNRDKFYERFNVKLEEKAKEVNIKTANEVVKIMSKLNRYKTSEDEKIC